MTSIAQPAPLQSFLSTLLRERRNSDLTALVEEEGSHSHSYDHDLHHGSAAEINSNNSNSNKCDECDHHSNNTTISIVVDNARTRRSETSWTILGNWIYQDGEIIFQGGCCSADDEDDESNKDIAIFRRIPRQQHHLNRWDADITNNNGSTTSSSIGSNLNTNSSDNAAVSRRSLSDELPIPRRTPENPFGNSNDNTVECYHDDTAPPTRPVRRPSLAANHSSSPQSSSSDGDRETLLSLRRVKPAKAHRRTVNAMAA